MLHSAIAFHHASNALLPMCYIPVLGIGIVYSGGNWSDGDILSLSPNCRSDRKSPLAPAEWGALNGGGRGSGGERERSREEAGGFGGRKRETEGERRKNGGLSQVGAARI